MHYWTLVRALAGPHSMPQRNVGVPLHGWRYSTIETEFFVPLLPPSPPPKKKTKYTLLTFTFSCNFLCKCNPTDHVPMTSYFPLVIPRNYTEGAEKKTHVFMAQHQLLRVHRIMKINPL
jgi:hypothetical protein